MQRFFPDREEQQLEGDDGELMAIGQESMASAHSERAKAATKRLPKNAPQRESDDLAPERKAKVAKTEQAPTTHVKFITFGRQGLGKLRAIMMPNVKDEQLDNDIDAMMRII